MKNFLLITTLLFSAVSYAATLPPAVVPGLPALPAAEGLKTYGAGLPLAELLKLTLGQVLHRPYVLTPAVSADPVLISADFTGVKPADVLAVLRQVLQPAGFSITDVRGVFVVDKIQPQKSSANDNGELLVYSPRYRSVTALANYFSVFPDVHVSYSAGSPRMANAAAVTTPTTPAGGLPGSPPVQATLAPDFNAGQVFNQRDGDPALLVARGSAARLAAFKELLAQVDIPTPQIIARAYVLEVRKTTSSQSGVSLAVSILNDRLKLNLGSAPTGGDTVKFSSSGASVSAVVGALAGDSRVRLMSAPVLRAADGTSASATIGTDTPTLGSVSTQNGVSTQSIMYQQAGVLLTVSPRIFEESIRLKISQEVSSFVATDTGLSNTPTKLRRSFVSDVVTAGGELILLGGLSDVSTTHSSSKNFLFFGADSDSDISSDIVVLLAIERA